jgi:Ser/Thr protein kinase RdoA (MazF antagonist)
MAHFPVSNSTLSATQLGFFLREQYQLKEDVSCQLIKAGLNDTYLIKSGFDTSIFRIYSLNWRTETEIREEIKLLKLLNENYIPLSYPLADSAGNYIQTFQAPEGERFGVMFSFAEGKKLLNYPAEIHFKVGEIMAGIHKITHNLKLDRVTYNAQTVLLDSFEQLKKFLPGDAEEMIFMKSAQRFLLDEFDKVNRNSVRQGIVHMDIWFDNLNVTAENKVTIFDFDFCGSGWLCFDLAYYILQLHSTEKDENERQLKVAGFLNGYESIIPIRDEEKRIIPMLGVSLYFFYLGIQCQRFENWSNSFLNETYLKRFINLLVKTYYEGNKLG